MGEDLLLTDCPIQLQDEVSKMKDNVPDADIFSVRKSESTPFIDKSRIVTTYRVFMQFGYEVAIYSCSNLLGGGEDFGKVSSSFVNCAELEIIAQKAKWIGDDLRRVLNQK